MPKISGINQRAAVAALEKASFVVIRQGRRIIMSKGVRTLNDPAAQSDQRVHVYVSGSIKTGLRAMIRAMKIYPVVINSVLAVIIVASSAHLTLADPPPMATPAAKLDPIEANDPEFSGNFDSLYQKT